MPFENKQPIQQSVLKDSAGTEISVSDLQTLAAEKGFILAGADASGVIRFGSVYRDHQDGRSKLDVCTTDLRQHELLEKILRELERMNLYFAEMVEDDF